MFKFYWLISFWFNDWKVGWIFNARTFSDLYVVVIRYDFVRQLRSRIDTTLTPLIDKKLEQLTGREGDRNNSVPTITEEIIASPE